MGVPVPPAFAAESFRKSKYNKGLRYVAMANRDDFQGTTSITLG